MAKEKRSGTEEQGRESRGETMATGRAGGVPASRRDMGLTRPWSFRQVFDEFDRMFEQMQRQFVGTPFAEAGRSWMAGGGWAPRLDFEDSGTELVVTAELPGFEPNEVQVDCTEDVLTIRGEHREQGEGSYAHRSFYRQLPVPPGCDPEQVKATFRNGLLRLRLPKSSQTGRRIPISSESEPSPETEPRAA